MTTRSRRLTVVLTIIGVVLVASAAVFGVHARGNTPTVSVYPTPTATPTPTPGPPVFTDDAYLAGSEYLYGMNVYSLIMGGWGESQESYDFLASRGVTVMRLAVPWQRLQMIPDGGTAIDGLNQPVTERYLEYVAQQVDRAGAAGIRTVLDLHNGCTYPWGAGNYVEGSLTCGQGITEDHVSYIWTALAERFRDSPYVIAYDVFNEPRIEVGVDTWKRFSQVAVDAIRATGDQHSVWIEGILSEYQGRLASMAPGGPWIEDPLDRVIYSEHFYAEWQGLSYDQVAEPRLVLDLLHDFGGWCRRWEVRCSVGEVGWASGGEGGVQSAESAAAFNQLFDEFYTIAAEYKLDVMYFAAASGNSSGRLLVYTSSTPRGPIDTVRSQAEVIERRWTVPAQ